MLDAALALDDDLVIADFYPNIFRRQSRQLRLHAQLAVALAHFNSRQPPCVAAAHEAGIPAVRSNSRVILRMIRDGLNQKKSKGFSSSAVSGTLSWRAGDAVSEDRCCCFPCCSFVVANAFSFCAAIGFSPHCLLLLFNSDVTGVHA